MAIVYNFINLFAQVLTFAILAQFMLSWVALFLGNSLPDWLGRLNTILVQITEPLLAPLRRVVPRLGMIDITPFIAILLLQALSWTVKSLP